VIRPGDVQRMSAGTGVTHSELNGSKSELVHFLQIWLLPKERGIKPSYEQKAFSDAEKRGRLRVVASPDGRDGSVTIHTNGVVYAGLFDAGESQSFTLDGAHGAWVHVARGKVRVNGRDLEAGDAVSLEGEATVRVEGVDGGKGEVLLFDLG
jgi:redox-sensitive bicupin YhaK (pirin superfamily)